MSSDPFDSFSIDNSQSGIIPKHHSIPTDVRSSRPFLRQNSPLPKMYYDLKVQDQRKIKKQQEKKDSK